MTASYDECKGCEKLRDGKRKSCSMNVGICVRDSDVTILELPNKVSMAKGNLRTAMFGKD